jgi:diaminopimelate decarboxylase
MRSEGLGLDVASGGELAIALSAGTSAEYITLHGNNKSQSELKAALDAGVGRIVADSPDEVDRLEFQASGMKVPPRILVRVNPGIVAETHKSIRTGHSNSKFGVSLARGSADDLVSRVRKSDNLHFGGIHVHIGSQMTDLEPLARAIEAAAKFAVSVHAEELIVGGGLGVPHRSGDIAPSVAAWGETARGAAHAGGFDGPLLSEPGRVLVAGAGVALYTIGTIKLGETTNFLAIDGGISDNPRPAMYQARYQPLLARHPYVSSEAGPYSVVGKNCESSDTFASGVDIPGNPKVGDLLCLPATGAYCYSMASQYNGLGRPAIAIAFRGQSRIIVRRETVEDLLNLDRVA